MDGLDRIIDGEEFGREDGGIVGKSSSKEGIKAVRGLENRCRSCFVCVGVFGSVCVNEVVVWMCLSIFKEELLDFLVGVLGFWVVEKEGDLRRRSIPPWEGFWYGVWFEKGKDKNSSVVGESLSYSGASTASVRVAWV